MGSVPVGRSKLSIWNTPKYTDNPQTFLDGIRVLSCEIQLVVSVLGILGLCSFVTVIVPAISPLIYNDMVVPGKELVE